MNNLNTLHKYTSLLLAIMLMVFTLVVPVSAAEDMDEDIDTYVFQRDGNGQPLYQYQSPCMIGYDLNNQYGGNGVPIQAFVYTMYNTQTQKHFPTYCTDINIPAVQGMYYRRMNLEYSPFAGKAAGKIRAILQKGFYIIPIEDESDAAHAARVAAKTAELGAAAGVPDLTTGEAIAATQAAIWQAAHGSEVTFPKFCRYLFSPTNTKYVGLCSYDELKIKEKEKGIEAINDTIETVYNYLLRLPPVAATSQVVSSSSFVKMDNLICTDNGDGSCTVSVDVTVDVDMDMEAGDSLDLYITLAEKISEKVPLTNGEQTKTLTIKDMSAEDISGDIKLFVSGTQTVSGFFYFDAQGGREASQAMVAYDSSQQPVYVELTAAPKEDHPDEDPVFPTGGINLLKIDAADKKCLEGASFEVYRPASAEEINAGAEDLVEIPGLAAKMVNVSFYDNPQLTGHKVTTVTSGDDGKVAIYGLPYGTYYLVETEAPAGYTLMADFKEVTINATSHEEEKTITIENRASILLPSTGGMGTTVYTVSGTALICIACLFSYMNKRKMTEI